MDASFRKKTSTRELMFVLLGITFLLGWSAVWIYFSLIDPRFPRPSAAAAMFGGIPLFFACAGVLETLAIRRYQLTIRGEHVNVRGLFRTTDLNLKEVTEARWYPRTGVRLRSASANLVISLLAFEKHEQEAIVGHLHSAIDPTAQIDWNLFVYKERRSAARHARTKPGPDEILVNRSYWDRRLLPFGLPIVIVAGTIGVVAWRMTGDPKHLGVVIGGVVAPVLGWVLVRYQIPAHGRIDRKVSTVIRSDPSLKFMLRGTAVFLIVLAILGVFWRRLTNPDLLLVSATLVWCVFIVWEMLKRERREERLDRELADLAGKDRGEPRADTWGVE
jgi:hypothetical protein